MDFIEIKKSQENFLVQNNIVSDFQDANISWDELMAIGEDFEEKSKPNGEYFNIIQEFIAKISTFENVHSYRYRIKKTESLLIKIIKKSKTRGTKITKNNYFREITDLLGIRILYVFKEDCLSVHEQIMNNFRDLLTEDVCIKLKTGDNESLYDEILTHYPNIKKENNTVYRSIHYTLNSKENQIKKYPKLEIQTRTIFEEGWSEINHKLVYKKGKCLNPYLSLTSTALSEMVGTCDNIGSLMRNIYDDAANRDKYQHGVADEEKQINEVLKSFLLN